MGLAAGDKLGPYEILAPIGAGGMGEVYRARDSRLNREVAIKVSAERFSERFDREARAVAALNHPNICTLFDVGPNYLVMELVEGPTLAERIKEGAIPLEESLALARQIADALEAAHDKGIVHRDLKPGNIKIKPDGTVKVLDFGLAKVAQGEARATSEDSPTLSMAVTQAGVILGTAAYMAPEQAKGKPVDKRADIWAFGVVLYEMHSGQRLFQGEDLTETLAAVVMKQPDLDRLPLDLKRVLKRCLEKDPRKRLRDITGFALLLEEGGTGVPRQAEARATLAWIVAGVGVALASVLGVLYYPHAREETRVLKFSALLPDKAGYNGFSSIPAVSPDGRRLAIALNVDGKMGLWIRDMDSTNSRLLPGTDGASMPFWAPDSRFVGFFADGKLKKIDVTGGPALTLCDSSAGRGGTWNQHDVIVFAPTNSGGLVRVSAAGGAVAPVTVLDLASSEINHRAPWFLPDGRHFLYTARNREAGMTTIYAGDVDAKDPTKNRSQVLMADSNAVYAPPGYLLFARDHTLMAQPFDAAKAQTSGNAVPIAEQVDFISGFSQAQFSASPTVVVSYTSGNTSGNIQLTWFDRTGRASGTLGRPGDIQWPAISPDGKTVAVDRRDPQTGSADIWTYDLARGTESRFTFGPRNSQWPAWSGDGSHIAFNANRDGLPDVYQRAISGTAQDELLDKAADNRVRPDDWSRDGRYFIEERPDDPKTKSDIWVLPLFGDKKPFAYLNSEFNETYAKLSPNGQWLAYTSDESKRSEIYVVTFPNLGGKWQVSTNGGTRPVWSRDGKELYFIGTDGKMMAVDIKGGANFDRGTPKPLFDTHIDTAAWFDVSKEGKFLLPAQLEQSAAAPMTVVINWQAALKR